MRARDFAPAGASEGRVRVPIAGAVEAETNQAGSTRATNVMATIRAVLAAGREPTPDESAELHGALNDPEVSQVEKKLLATLAKEVERQANGRAARTMADAIVTANQEKAKRVAQRQEHFDALHPMIRAAWLMQNAEFLRFAELCSRNTKGTPPPAKFEVEDSPAVLFGDGRP